MARPTLYDESLCDVVEEALATGKSLAASAGELGVHRDTVLEWMGVHPEFSGAVKRGRARGMAKWEQRLWEQAESNGGNTAAIIFAMKNLYRDDWNDRTAVEHSGPNGEPIASKLIVENVVIRSE